MKKLELKYLKKEQEEFLSQNTEEEGKTVSRIHKDSSSASLTKPRKGDAKRKQMKTQVSPSQTSLDSSVKKTPARQQQTPAKPGHIMLDLSGKQASVPVSPSKTTRAVNKPVSFEEDLKREKAKRISEVEKISSSTRARGGQRSGDEASRTSKSDQVSAAKERKRKEEQEALERER